MADNILTKDRADANLDIAAKDVGGIKFPRNILTDPAGNDLTPLTDAQLRATPIPVLDANVAAATHQEDAAHTSGDYGQLMLAVRWDSDTATANDGDYTVLKMDEAGRLKVATQPGSVAAVAGSITAAARHAAVFRAFRRITAERSAPRCRQKNRRTTCGRGFVMRSPFS